MTDTAQVIANAYIRQGKPQLAKEVEIVDKEFTKLKKELDKEFKSQEHHCPVCFRRIRDAQDYKFVLDFGYCGTCDNVLPDVGNDFEKGEND
jgi:hypothetical protein